MDDVGLDALVGELPKCVLIEDLGMLYPNENSKRKCRFGIYECGFCGTNFKAQTQDVKKGNTKSCGCYRRNMVIKMCNNNNNIHGGRGTKLYEIWASIKARTNNTKSKDYVNYGGRGITMCEGWFNGFTDFRDWSLENGYEEDKGLSIDRIDNDGNYEPSNCRWTTITIQNRNQRIRKDNTSGYKGVTFDKGSNNFRASIQLPLGRVRLGHFLTAVEGGIAYNNYILENNLEGFILNTIPEEFKDIIPQRLTKKKRGLK